MELVTPHNLEAEMAVLGSIFIDESLVAEIIDELYPEDFYDNKNKIIFNTIVSLYNEGKNIDLTSVVSALEIKGLFSQAGGMDYLNTIVNYNYSAINVGTYVDLVHEAALKRVTINALTDLAQKGYSPEKNANEYLTKVEEVIFDLSKRRKTSNFVPITEVTSIVKEKLTRNLNQTGDITGLSTGFSNLDHATLGFQPEQLIILAARPAMGKSALAMNIAVNAAQANKNGKAVVACFSLEMGMDQLVERMIAADGLLHLQSIKTGQLTGQEPRQYQASCEKLNHLNLYFDDSSLITLEDIRTKCRKLKASPGLDLVVIDYLQLIDGTGSGAKSRQEEVSKISRGLKMMARELQIPVLALAQLSREVEKRDDKKPIMADLRDSGSIEQDADIVMFLYREEYYNKNKTEENKPSQPAILSIAKNRSGSSGMDLDFIFQGQYSKFTEVEKGEQ